ncbi:hypothetical protein ES705_41010 [subsurface metagenome]
MHGIVLKMTCNLFMGRFKITNKQRLEHIIEAINKIENYCKDQDIKSFCKTEILHDAVLHQFLIIGEAIINIDKDILDKYKYPWHSPRSFRNYIAHEYFGINPEKVWNTVTIEIPLLKEAIDQIYRNY